MDDDRLLRDQTVVVSGGRIAAMGPSATTPVPAGARVVDATGRYLMPGLADMHVHLYAPAGADALRRQRRHHGLRPERPPGVPRLAAARIARGRAARAHDLLGGADVRPPRARPRKRSRRWTGRPPRATTPSRSTTRSAPPSIRRSRRGEEEEPRPRRARRARARIRGHARRRTVDRARRGVRLHVLQRRPRSEERGRPPARHDEDPEGRREDARGRRSPSSRRSSRSTTSCGRRRRSRPICEDPELRVPRARSCARSSSPTRNTYANRWPAGAPARSRSSATSSSAQLVRALHDGGVPILAGTDASWLGVPGLQPDRGDRELPGPRLHAVRRAAHRDGRPGEAAAPRERLRHDRRRPARGPAPDSRESRSRTCATCAASWA